MSASPIPNTLMLWRRTLLIPPEIFLRNLEATSPLANQHRRSSPSMSMSTMERDVPHVAFASGETWRWMRTSVVSKSRSSKNSCPSSEKNSSTPPSSSSPGIITRQGAPNLGFRSSSSKNRALSSSDNTDGNAPVDLRPAIPIQHKSAPHSNPSNPISRKKSPNSAAGIPPTPSSDACT